MAKIYDQRYIESLMREFIINWQKKLAKELIADKKLGVYLEQTAQEMFERMEAIMSGGYYNEREAWEIVQSEYMIPE